MAQNLNALEEITAAIKTISVAGDELANAAVPVKLASFAIAKGPSLTLGPSQLSFSAGLSADIEEFNSEDDSDEDGILGAGGSASIALSKESAWLKYRLGGTLRLQGGAVISSIGFSLEADAGLDLFDYRFHDRTEKLASAVAADLRTPRFVFDFAHILALKPKEALALRAGGSVSLGVSIAWSDVLTAGLKAFSSLLRAATPVNITISTGLQAGLDVTLSGELLIVFSVGDDKSLRLSLRKASTRGLAGTVTAGLSARFGNLDKALVAGLDSLVAGDFRKVLARVENAKAGTLTPLPSSSSSTISCSRAAALKVSAAASSTRTPPVGQVARELADAGGLAGTVDAGDHDHRRRLAELQRPLERREQFGDRIGQQRLHRRRLGGLGVLHAALQVDEQVLGGAHAGIGHQQRRFQLLVERVVDARAGEDLGDARTGALQPGLQPGNPRAALGHRRVLDGGFRGGAGRGGRRQRGLGRRGGRLPFEEAEHLALDSRDRRAP